MVVPHSSANLVLFELVTWLFAGWLLVWAQRSLFDHPSLAVWVSGMLGALVGGYLARWLELPALAVHRYSLTHLISAAAVAEVAILVAHGLRKPPKNSLGRII
jgi:uncharacterized membrane protein YeaQ/YmgE (transglycosylase-associated protein family)